FTEFKEPSLDTGTYTISVTQEIQGDTFTAKKEFEVCGERCSLNPSAIRATFPPQGTLGEY
ncbi:MAG: hypothetical protein HRT70_09820, partial [Flavobacteriaceae bacterium]|nr:hypothetical protein [Flavobacteriaceae bacterium]